MSGHLTHRSADRRPLIRPITALGGVVGAALVTLTASAVPVLAAPPPLVPVDTSGPSLLQVQPLTPVLQEGMTTGQVVVISLLVSPAVAALVLGVALLVRSLQRSTKPALKTPAPRFSTASATSPASAARPKVSSR